MRAMERTEVSARTMVSGKGQAKIRAMGPGLRPELGLEWCPWRVFVHN